MAVTKFLARDLDIGIFSPAVGGNQTGVAATDLITAASAHGFVAGTPVRFLTLTGGAGLVVGTVYYVIAAGLTATVYSVSATPGGSAFNFTTDITVGTVAKATFIGGINTLTHSPSTEQADTTDFDSAGRAEHFIAQRGDEWTIAGFALLDVVAATRDPGQKEVETLAQSIGLSSLGTFLIRDPANNKILFLASAEVTQGGGGHNDPAAWSAKITVSGAVTYVPGP